MRFDEHKTPHAYVRFAGNWPRVAMDSEGAFVEGGASGARQWIDFTDPVVMPEDLGVQSFPADDEVRLVRTEAGVGGEPLRVFAQFGPASVSDVWRGPRRGVDGSLISL